MNDPDDSAAKFVGTAKFVGSVRASSDKRQLVMYKQITEFPTDWKPGERLPVIRGDGPREGDLIGHATIDEDGMVSIEPEEGGFSRPLRMDIDDGAD